MLDKKAVIRKQGGIIMIRLLGIGFIFSIIVINYCACKISGEISKEEEMRDLHSKMQKL